MCAEMPDPAYICECCDFYSESEQDIKDHMRIHFSNDDDYTLDPEAEQMANETERREAKEMEVTVVSDGGSDAEDVETSPKDGKKRELSLAGWCLPFSIQ